MNEQQRKLVLDWMRKIHQLEYAHRYDSKMWENREKWIGISAALIATLVVFSYQFPAIEAKEYNKLCFLLKRDYFVPFASLCVAILTGLQTSLRPSEKSEIHKRTASNYEKLRHRVEVVLVTGYSENEFNEKLRVVREEWESLDAINVSDKNFLKGKVKALSFKKYNKELDFLDDVSASQED